MVWLIVQSKNQSIDSNTCHGHQFISPWTLARPPSKQYNLKVMGYPARFLKSNQSKIKTSASEGSGSLRRPRVTYKYIMRFRQNSLRNWRKYFAEISCNILHKSHSSWSFLVAGVAEPLWDPCQVIVVGRPKKYPPATGSLNHHHHHHASSICELESR